MRGVPAIDASGIHAFNDVINNLEKRGVRLVISHANEQPLQVFRKSGIYKKIGAENFCPNIEAALERAEELAK